MFGNAFLGVLAGHQKAAQQLAAAFSLQSVDMICDGDGSKCQMMQREPQAEMRES